ncbi:MAG: hypothetical protein K8W52_34495 [Deltaproteobacteria bacterium]|nr:hypothetical protein [Deltaproteobacteria bacterium]
MSRRPQVPDRSLAALRRFGGLVGGLAAMVLAGCPKAPSAPAPVAGWPAAQVSITATTAAIRSVAVDAQGGLAVAVGQHGPLRIADKASDATGDATAIARLAPGGGRVTWLRTIAGTPGPIAIAGDRVVAALGATGELVIGDRRFALRGAPGALIVSLFDKDGSVRWADTLGATDWVQVASLTAMPDGGVVAGGGFAGTLRVGAATVTSAGSSDGWVARLGADGAVRWLVRLGGHDGDSVAGVAAAGDQVAIAGTFTGDAELRGTALEPIDADSAQPDGFVALLDASGAPAWAHRFGSAVDDQVAGVAVTRDGHVAVAATVRDMAYLGSAMAMVTAGGIDSFEGHGAADGLVAIWDARGSLSGSVMIGGTDYDGLRAIAAHGDELVVGGWFAGAMDVAGTRLTAGGGDDAFVAVVDTTAHVSQALAVSGDGREDVPALAAGLGGWVAALGFTAAASLGDTRFAAPADPGGGAAIVVRAR